MKTQTSATPRDIRQDVLHVLLALDRARRLHPDRPLHRRIDLLLERSDMTSYELSAALKERERDVRDTLAVMVQLGMVGKRRLESGEYAYTSLPLMTRGAARP